jgi:Ser/Thr protein kinase RdoA (MazF antagonist)
MLAVPQLVDRLEPLVGAPVALRELKRRPGRRSTLRATGPNGRVIVKLYNSARAPIVAARVDALSRGPDEPLVPRLLLLDARLHVVVLSEVPGRSLGSALLEGIPGAAERAGAVLAAWHRGWKGAGPTALRHHTLARESDVLTRQAERAPSAIAARVLSQLPGLLAGIRPWGRPTVVHRDLYEEQILLSESVGLIDLDDAALGPPELDIGNLWAHLDLLALRSGRVLDDARARLLAAYQAFGPDLDRELLQTCRLLTRLRLACIHSLPELIDGAGGRHVLDQDRS